MLSFTKIMKMIRISYFSDRLYAYAYALPPPSYESNSSNANGPLQEEQLSVTCEIIGSSNWSIAIRMASTVALKLSSHHNIKSSVYSGTNYKE